MSHPQQSLTLAEEGKEAASWIVHAGSLAQPAPYWNGRHYRNLETEIRMPYGARKPIVIWDSSSRRPGPRLRHHPTSFFFRRPKNSQLIARHYRTRLRGLGIMVASCSAVSARLLWAAAPPDELRVLEPMVTKTALITLLAVLGRVLPPGVRDHPPRLASPSTTRRDIVHRGHWNDRHGCRQYPGSP